MLRLITEKCHEAIEKFQRAYIAEKLKKLTPDQLAFYHRLYPNGPTKDQILTAADQIERTIKKNGIKN